ncbi:tetratricopeptide repeat protein, partial [Roseomonas rosulenta]|uniref:tetratricopeptide repeat protein n=1 Tax=Roseomonas rosulenta TaxID=2748667 RepID=UPI0018E03A24
RLLLREGQPMRADAMFRRLLAAEPGRAEAYLGRADALLALELRERAVAALRAGLAQRPGDAALAARLRELTAPAIHPRSGVLARLRGLFAAFRRRPGG